MRIWTFNLLDFFPIRSQLFDIDFDQTSQSFWNGFISLIEKLLECSLLTLCQFAEISLEGQNHQFFRFGSQFSFGVDQVQILPPSQIPFFNDVGFGSSHSFFCLFEGVDSIGGSDVLDKIDDDRFVLDFSQIVFLFEFLCYLDEAVEIVVLLFPGAGDHEGHRCQYLALNCSRHVREVK